MVAFVNNDLAVVSDQVPDLTFASEALDHRHIDVPASNACTTGEI